MTISQTHSHNNKERENSDEARKDKAKLKSSDACFHKEPVLFVYAACDKNRLARDKLLFSIGQG